MYVIENTNDPSLFWSNEHGWVSGIGDASRFTRAERNAFNVPLEGDWRSLWEIDELQFARFIAECEAAGVFGGEAMERVADSMDLSQTELSEIIERAQRKGRSLTLYELLQTADKAYAGNDYESGLITSCYDRKQQELRPVDPAHGDTLARFVAVELVETFDAEAARSTQLAEAARVLLTAAKQLRGVAEAF